MTNWIQKAFLDNDYEIIPVSSNGDCFFEAVILALKTLDRYGTNAKLTVSNMRRIIANQLTPDIFDAYKTLYEDSVKENDQLGILQYGFMQNVDSLERLKSLSETNAVWANETTLSIFEKTFRIKLILFHEKQAPPYLESPEIIDEKLNPTLYILLSFNGGHYDLVCYRNRVVFTLELLPPFLKNDLWRNVSLFQKKVVGWESLSNLLKTMDS